MRAPTEASFVAVRPPLVVDASTAVDVLVDADAAAAWRSWQEAGRLRVVPPHFWHELGNALLRSRRLPLLTVVGLLHEFESQGLDIADRGPAGVRASVELADKHGLTVYDAAYLWLAIDV